MTDRVYIPHLREGSDDCWDGFSWEGRYWWMAMRPTETRHCAVWTGTADRDTLAHFGPSGSPRQADD